MIQIRMPQSAGIRLDAAALEYFADIMGVVVEDMEPVGFRAGFFLRPVFRSDLEIVRIRPFRRQIISQVVAFIDELRSARNAASREPWENRPP